MRVLLLCGTPGGCFLLPLRRRRAAFLRCTARRCLKRDSTGLSRALRSTAARDADAMSSQASQASGGRCAARRPRGKPVVLRSLMMLRIAAAGVATLRAGYDLHVLVRFSLEPRIALQLTCARKELLRINNERRRGFTARAPPHRLTRGLKRLQRTTAPRRRKAASSAVKHRHSPYTPPQRTRERCGQQRS